MRKFSPAISKVRNSSHLSMCDTTRVSIYFRPGGYRRSIKKAGRTFGSPCQLKGIAPAKILGRASMTRLCRCRSVSRASQDRRRCRLPRLKHSDEHRILPTNQTGNATFARSAKQLNKPDIVCVAASRTSMRTCFRKRPTHHDDRSSPTDRTGIDAKHTINSTPLSAHREGCQATFSSTIFCVKLALAKSDCYCSALRFGAVATISVANLTGLSWSCSAA